MTFRHKERERSQWECGIPQPGFGRHPNNCKSTALRGADVLNFLRHFQKCLTSFIASHCTFALHHILDDSLHLADIC